MQTETAYRQALQVALQDLSRYGVTALLGSQPNAWKNHTQSVPKKVEPPLKGGAENRHDERTERLGSPRKTALAGPKESLGPPQKCAIWQVASLGECVNALLEPCSESVPLWLVVSTEQAGEEKVFSEEALLLLGKMLKALEQASKSSFVCKGVTAVQEIQPAETEADKRMAAEHCQAKLAEHLQEVKDPAVVLCVGSQTVRRLTEADWTPARRSLKEGAFQEMCGLSGLSKKMGVGLVAHPELLLRQPVMKRAAWQDLLCLAESLGS